MPHQKQYEISQWLQILKEPWRRMCLKEWRRRPVYGKRNNIADAVLWGIWWNNSTVDVFDDLQDGLDTDPIPYVQPKYRHLLK